MDLRQRRKGNPRKKNSGYRSCSFCRTQEALLRCIREYAGEVDTLKLSADFGRSPIGTTTGAAEMTARTWTFLERTKIGLKRRQNP